MNPSVQNQIYEEIQQKEKFNYEDIRDFKVNQFSFFIRQIFNLRHLFTLKILRFKIAIFSIWMLV